MNNILPALILAVTTPAVVTAKPLSIVKDYSSSTPLLTNEQFAEKAALAAIDKFDALGKGDKLTVRSLGEVGLKNLDSFSAVIKRKNRKKLRRHLYQKIAETPSQHIESQQQTNILFFLKHTRFNCAAGEEIFIISDGVESSELISSRKLLSGTPLPEPKRDFLKGCTVTLYGLSMTNDPLPLKQTQNLINAWEKWMAKAGATFIPEVSP